MTEEEQKLWRKILVELFKQFPDLNPKIAKVLEKTFTYELEKHDNYTYYSVRYSITPTGELIVDWESAELTMF
jgi:ABC-type Zn2+ transport system substrate-binding protein/surface adhesin